MADYAHNETDKRIAELEKRLTEEYRQAYKETKDKLEKYLSDFKRKDEKKRQEVENGTLSEKDYKTWRRNQMLTGQRWADMVDTLAKDMNNANVIAAQIVSGEMPEAFSLNANYTAYEIENGYRQNYGFTLYDRDTVDRLVSENPDLLPEPSVDIPADLRWNKQKIVSNITQAVLQGKSIPEIAKSMETVVGMNKASAVRNARTAMTGAQNAGRQQAYERAAAMGIKLQKEWIATLDGRTRHSHGKADGQKTDINGMFSVGGCKMRYPGDVQNGTAAEIYNCRCTMCTVEPPEIMQGEEPRMTYSEWVQTKEGQAATGGRYAQKTLDNGGGSGKIEEKPHEYSEQAKNIIKKCELGKIDHNEVQTLESALNSDEIWQRISGGDKTKGSCSSAAFAYIGNRCGYDVLDFRGGESQEFFAQDANIKMIAELPGVNKITVTDKKEIKAGIDLLNDLELDKEYYFSIGKHAAIVRRTIYGAEYLELQSAQQSGWQKFDGGRYGTMANTLYKRFGCRKTVDRSFGKVWEQEAYAMEVDSFKDNDDFKHILGYLNTSGSNQKKGASGNVK